MKPLVNRLISRAGLWPLVRCGVMLAAGWQVGCTPGTGPSTQPQAEPQPESVQEIAPGEIIQARVSSASEGTTFLLRSGVHRLQTITPKSGQTFTGEAGTILSGAKVLTAFTRSGSAWVASAQPQQGAVTGGADVCLPSHPRCVYPEDLFFDDRPLLHVPTLSAGGPGKWHFDYPGDRIYIWDDPAGRLVETSVTPHAFAGNASKVTLRDLIVEKYATPTQNPAVRMGGGGGSGWTMERCEVRLNHSAGVGTYDGSTVRDSLVHQNGALGFVGAGPNILIERNEIAHNNFAGYDPFWEAGGSKWVYTTRLVVRDNFSHHNQGPGLWTDINNIDTLYEGNRVEDNERGGILHEISYAAVIRSNVLRRNGTGRHHPYWTTGAGIEVVGSPDVEVYGNTLEDNWQGITGLADHRGAGNAGPYALVNLYVHDNHVTSRLNVPGGGATGVIDTAGTAAFQPAANNRFVGNTYVLGANTHYFVWMGAHRTYEEWRAYRQQ